MRKRIRILRDDASHLWVVILENSPIMGNAAWMYETWDQCMMHAEVLRRVWDHV